MNQNYNAVFTVDQSPEVVFNAINNVRGWWSQEIEGDTDKLGTVFSYHYKDIHRCKMEITELIRNEKVVWYVQENYFSFTQDKTEWTGTTINFEISRKGDKTEVKFTHIGLVPHFECFNTCTEGWNNYVNGSLRSLITTGIGQPNIGDPITDSERSLSQ
ncbi:SRPBCC domain-containing protein [Paenibacillus mesophilus]|uniref:SRPBCC family protein n=1 Tax=Paenibacillus mesophilus TaxID=2582849 RepID=UPI00110F68C5|nr:SRPBCC domain-containing protein [Paenibacillus mesophilus]TMV42836.1 SRPBCC domain-containing protein [Paenibacillus mesophilus]